MANRGGGLRLLIALGVALVVAAYAAPSVQGWWMHQRVRPVKYDPASVAAWDWSEYYPPWPMGLGLSSEATYWLTGVTWGAVGVVFLILDSAWGRRILRVAGSQGRKDA